MSFNITEIESVPADQNLRGDGAPRTVMAKQRERDTLATDIDRFLAQGGKIEQVQVGATGRTIEH